jgi:hypothetical protein
VQNRQRRTDRFARADVIERACHYDVDRLGLAPLVAQRLGRDLADGIGTSWLQRLLFGDREVCGGYQTIGISGTDVQQSSGEARMLECGQQVERAQKIDFVGLARIGE